MSIQLTIARAMRPRLFRSALALFVLFGCGCFLDAAHAQGLPNDPSADAAVFTTVIPLTAAVKLSDLSSTDLSYMSASWWKDVRKEHIRLLRSSDEQIREQAMQNLIYFARVYRDQVDLTRAAPMLYRIYKSDENEDHRVMALSALHAIGNRNVMELLRKDVQYETSERVRRFTLLALADYYK